MFTWLSLARFGVPLILGWIIYDFGSSFVTKFQGHSDTIASLNNKIRLLEARDLSNKRMLERRDDAIAASQCKAQIDKWLSNPHTIPKPFDPHNQLTPKDAR